MHDVLDLLQKHTLVEADISAQAERIKAVQGAAQRFTSYEQGESSNMLLHILCTEYAALVYLFVYNVTVPCIYAFSHFQPTNRVSQD